MSCHFVYFFWLQAIFKQSDVNNNLHVSTRLGKKKRGGSGNSVPRAPVIASIITQAMNISLQGLAFFFKYLNIFV